MRCETSTEDIGIGASMSLIALFPVLLSLEVRKAGELQAIKAWEISLGTRLGA